MDASKASPGLLPEFPREVQVIGNPLRSRLRHWQQVRTWARLIREAEFLWRVDVKELRRLGELELSQLLHEVPPSHRGRVNRWLIGYAVGTRFKGKDSISCIK